MAWIVSCMKPVLCWVVLLGMVTCLPDRENPFIVCKKRRTTTNILELLMAPSLVRCAALCLNTQQCYSANYNPKTKECELSTRYENQNCGNLLSDVNTKYLEFTSPCKNGGVWNRVYKNCTCISPYVGKTCHRVPRDCSEWVNPAASTKIPVKPLKSDITYNVYCAQETTVMFSLFLFFLNPNEYTRSWQEYKDGFYAGSGRGLWSGLEDIHQLTRHARYDLVVIIHDLPSIRSVLFYNNFRLGPESDNYAMYYDSFEKCRELVGIQVNCYDGEDGFSGYGQPGKNMNGSGFGTVDHDQHGCASSNQFAWWYNTDCAYVAPNMNDDTPLFKWPLLSGPDLEVKLYQSQLFLQYFYDTE